MKQYLLNGFQFGFRIPYEGLRKFRSHKNLKSANENKLIIADTIQSEISKKRVEGPFYKPPFPNLQCSPLGLVPKKESGKFRMIHHLSFPEGGSINDGISHEHCAVKYQSLDDAVAQIKKFGVGALLAKTDIAEAFKNIPIHPDDFELLGFTFNEQFYFDKTLPFGLSFSCNLFEKFSTALHWILTSHFKNTGCVHVLDDYLFIGPPSSNNCQKDLHNFLSLCQDIGLPIKHEKTVLPTTTLTFLGLEIDTVKYEMRLPLDKLRNLRETLVGFQYRRKTTLRELQSLIGLLNFACTVVVPGRPFLRRLIDLTKGIQRPHHFRKLNSEARADIKAWLLFIEYFNGKALILSDIWSSSNVLNLYTDASNLGFGGTFHKHWFYGSWPKEWLDHHITIKELFPIVLALDLYSDMMKNQCIEFFSDNEAVVHIINTQTSKNAMLMKLVRKLVLISMKFNILFKATHIPGVHNVSSDKLSRLQIEEFRNINPSMNVNPTPVLPHQLII
ncbi:hypothetical protein FSP39_000299 [Pinctada imbricata]|uniref:Reverse transcriptase domain-containing protein n=1 Tax=Pinctada imbricata TaxID=66713 RepID=A0AA89BST6_PINIB|nr:hypothetical protein FSP39_000299 [Pinctada imbricata]